MIREEKGSVCFGNCPLEIPEWRSMECLSLQVKEDRRLKNYCSVLWDVSRRTVHSGHSAMSLSTLHLFAHSSLTGWLVAKWLLPFPASPGHSRQKQEGKREEQSHPYLPLLWRKQRTIFLKPHWPDLGHAPSQAVTGKPGEIREQECPQSLRSINPLSWPQDWYTNALNKIGDLLRKKWGRMSMREAINSVGYT